MTDWLVGGYGADLGGTSSGIRWARSGPDGEFEVGELAAQCPSPSWLTVHGDRVYAALEGVGELAVFRIAGERLEPEVRVPAGGTLPCHLAVVGDAVVVACYGDGAVAVHAPPGAEPRVLPGPGSGPHAHHVLVQGDRVLTLDLGADALHVHDLAMTRISSVPMPTGTGPRDLLALPEGRLVVLGELGGEVLVLSPSLEVLDRAPLPGFVAGDHAAGLALVHGRFVVTGIRGSNRLAVLEATDTGMRTVASVAAGGERPRHVVADGAFVHVSNQGSNSIATFSIGDTGVPELVGEPVAAASPTCLAAVTVTRNV